MRHKIVINSCYGGFSISQKAVEWMRERGSSITDKYDYPSRVDPLFVECVETLGPEADDNYSRLRVDEFEGEKYRICEYDGMEWVETPDTIDWETIE